MSSIPATIKYLDPYLKPYELNEIDYTDKNQNRLVSKVLEAMLNDGACIVKNVPWLDEDELLKTCKAFAAIPEAEKMKLAVTHLSY